MPGTGSTGTGTGATGSGAGGINLNLGGSGTGGMGKPPGGGIIEDPPLTECATADDCCSELGCDEDNQYLCNAKGYCGLISGTCDEQADCQADTYCCMDADCLPAGGEAVCIPANVPPGAPCTQEVEPGVFAPAVQCEWTGPKAGEPFTASKHVLSTPLVADLPIDSGASAEIVFVSYDGAKGDGSADAPGIIRIVSGQTCELKASIDAGARASATPALADLDHDGFIDIVARRNAGGVVAYRWNEANKAYEHYWTQTTDIANLQASQAWDGVSVHDLNDDDYPEVIARYRVYDGRTGAVLGDTGDGASNFPWNGVVPVLGDFDDDNKVEIVMVHSSWPWDLEVYEWANNKWNADGGHFGTTASHLSVADLGTPGATANDFNWSALDGKAEIITTTHDGTTDVSHVKVYTLNGQTVMNVDTTESGACATESGGMPTVGDFDHDGLPEIGVAGASYFRVFDPEDCKQTPGDCAEPARFVRWKQKSQDCSSRQTSASIFDFDGDDQAEAVYADECFLRVYDGTTGKVLYSQYRNSGTWLENPIVADVDKDQNTEIVVNSTSLVSITCGGNINQAYVDPIHAGMACDENAACPNSMACTNNLCRCSTDADCCGGAGLAECGLTCAAAIDGSGADGKVCRSTHPNNTAGERKVGIRVLRDGLDRWASSRPMWNQHAYSITNINDDGSVPRASEWKANYREPGLNNFLQNAQGDTSFEDLPDITGSLTDDEPCVTGKNGIYLQARVCNRGKRAVGAELPATFYEGDPKDNNVLCTSYTDGPVPTGGCMLVWCEIDAKIAGKTVSLVVNDDGKGGQTTIECRPDNNGDDTMVDTCDEVVPR